MRPSRRLRLPAVALASVLLAALTSTSSFASWTSPGSGTGTATAGTAVALVTSTAGAATTSLLYPNGPAAEVRFIVLNANPYPVTVTGVAANGPTSAAGGLGVCLISGVSLVTPASGLPISVPARVGAVNGSVTVSLGGAATMSGASETGCQGATFTIPLSLTAVSAAP